MSPLRFIPALNPVNSNMSLTVRSIGPWFTRTLAVSLLAFGLAIIGPGNARADISYTWHEDDAESVQINLNVLSATQAAGRINFADITSATLVLSYYPPSFASTEKYSKANLDPSLSLGISSVDASPVSGAIGLSPLSDRTLFVAFDRGWNTIGGESLVYGTIDFSALIIGHGHWTIGGTAVPEPSSAILTTLGSVTSILLGFRRLRRSQPTSA